MVGGFSGPGWANRLVIIIIRDLNGGLREEALQPSEQTRDMSILATISEAAHHQMVAAVSAIRPKRKPKP